MASKMLFCQECNIWNCDCKTDKVLPMREHPSIKFKSKPYVKTSVKTETIAQAEFRAVMERIKQAENLKNYLKPKREIVN